MADVSLDDSESKMKPQAGPGGVAVVGLGYVGLSTALCFASRGFHVTGIDVDKNKPDSLRRGIATFSEDGIESLLRSTRKKISFTSDIGGVEGSDAIFITVGTPSRYDGSVDLAQVRSAARSIGKAIKGGTRRKLVIVKSTVVPGTTRDIVKSILKKESGGAPFGLVANPEFLREGSAIADTFSPDRIVIGSDEAGAAEELLAIYRGFYGERMPPVLVTNLVNAEMVKYASNAFLATKISFINEIANLCGRIPGADVRVVAKGMGMDPRIGPRFLNAGLGYGGSCFRKDVRALLAESKKRRVPLRIAEAALATNTQQPLVAIGLAEALGGSLRGKKVAVLGLAFKPGTDDMREAVSLTLVRGLKKRGSRVWAYDPKAMANARRLLGSGVTFGESAEECLRGASGCIVATEWEEFGGLKPEDFKRLMKNPVVVDGRGVLDPAQFRGSGVKFASVGLGEPVV